MPTDCLFREDSYLKECEAELVALTEQGGIVLDRTIFYAASGGQPADRGTLTGPAGETIAIEDVIYTDPAKSEIAHVPAAGAPHLKARRPRARGDRLGSAPCAHAHAYRVCICCRPSCPIRSPAARSAKPKAGSISTFRKPASTRTRSPPSVNAMIAADAAVTARWITDEELAANPGLVKTMSVKPPMGTGRVRLIEIAGLDLQPCGGTHVRSTAEIGTRARHPDREEGQAEPPRAAGAGVKPQPGCALRVDT